MFREKANEIRYERAAYFVHHKFLSEWSEETSIESAWIDEIDDFTPLRVA